VPRRLAVMLRCDERDHPRRKIALDDVFVSLMEYEYSYPIIIPYDGLLSQSSDASEAPVTKLFRGARHQE
jgi:hypothetical protein